MYHFSLEILFSRVRMSAHLRERTQCKCHACSRTTNMRLCNIYVSHTREQTNLSADVIWCDVARQINADYDDCTQDLARANLSQNYFSWIISTVKASKCACGVLSLNKLNPSPFPQVRGKAVLLYFKLENFGYSFKIHAYFDPDFLVMFINLNIPFDSASQKTSK